MSEKGYNASPAINRAPGVYVITGPGMPRHSNTVWVGGETPERHALHIAALLSLAFEAGREAAKRDIRHSMGV